MQVIPTNQTINCELTSTARISKTFQWLKSFHWVLKQFEWFLWKYWSTETWKKRKVLIVFDHMVAYKLKEFLQVVTESFIAAKKSNISLISLYSNILLFQKVYANLNKLSYHGNPKFMWTTATNYLNYSLGIDYYDFMVVCRRTYFITNININNDNW